MQPPERDPARDAVLDELRRSALEVYGEERAAETMLTAALEAAATAVWRVRQVGLEPQGPEPLPTHD
jgi:RNase P/RNase MRP subunit POP5